MNDLITIIIPNYNKAAYLPETLDSVTNQTYANWEAILIDDGSTDSSINIMEAYCKKEPRFKYMKRDRLPKGGSTCRNIGLANAKGKHIIFLDSDDILTKNCLNDRINAISKYPDNKFWIFTIGTFYKKIGDHNSLWIPKGKNFIYRFLQHDLPWHTMSVIWQKKFLMTLGGFDEEYPRLQDVELHTRAVAKEKKFKTFINAYPDSFFRIDEKRIITNHFEFLSNWELGVALYIKKIQLIIIKDLNNNKILLNKLKGTAISMLTTLLHRKSIDQINTEEYEYLRNHLLWSNGVKKLFNNCDYFIIFLYEKMYKIGFYKIKGFNFIFKKIITS